MHNNNANMNEQELINDALMTEKHMLHAYGTYLPEATCQNLRNELNQIISETQQVQYEIFDAMQKKGWYNTKNAQLQEVQKASESLGQVKNQMV